MNSFDYIIHPTTAKKVKVNTTLGNKIINNYAKILNISSPSINKVSNTIQNKLEDNQTLDEFRNIIDETFKITIDELLNHTQRILTEEQYINLAIIHYNIMKMDNNTILEQYNELNTDQKNPSNHNLVILILKCLGMQQEDILSIMPSEQQGGWYGCVEPGLTHEQVQQKSPVQKRRMCQRNTGLPVGRFANSQTCVQSVMHDPTLCNPPPTLGERVSAAASGARSGLESNFGTIYIGLMSFLRTNPSIGIISAAILSIIVVLTCVLSGFSRSLDTSITDFFRKWREDVEINRQADERNRRQREEEETRRNETNRRRRQEREQMQRERERMHRERREAIAQRERKRIARKRIRTVIKSVLSVSKFVKDTQVKISDKLRLGTDSNYVSLVGYRVHVVGIGYGNITGYNQSRKRDIISYDIRDGRVLANPLEKTIVLGITRRYKKNFRNRVGKAFRLISNINNQLVPWPMPNIAIPVDYEDEDVPMARVLSIKTAARQRVAPAGIILNAESMEQNPPMARTLTDE